MFKFASCSILMILEMGSWAWAPLSTWGLCLRDWSWSGGSYRNNTRVICFPAPGRPERAAQGTSLPDNKSQGCCCRNSLPTVINPNYNMTKQLCMKRIYDKICSKSPSNRATSFNCLQFDIMHLSLTTGVVAKHIRTHQSWLVTEKIVSDWLT